MKVFVCVLVLLDELASICATMRTSLVFMSNGTASGGTIIVVIVRFICFHPHVSLQQEMLEYMGNGVRLAWLIDPVNECVFGYHLPTPSKLERAISGAVFKR